MLKKEAIDILGGTVTSAARAVGVSPQAVSLWPDVLSDAIRDRVQAALWRQKQSRYQRKSVPVTSNASEAA